ncbi:transcriptional regulator with XRE-family HTH domain [Salinibacter ruber]|uniref:Transcriptional regulator with XRE-family HTH domain n=1 Tax=Salinibacter ruber TaxID=146919 RepID=A0A9X2U377_9BACT|nr:helix-turn-helix transcriptional regulator [Salinibacter ruber]MCS3859077.1 transcriptional regulator with XRE-family HTH domain [Salinibacter ruber]MCS3865846.1 transcriptional regulator with XRE-family HTH domain [Salinibacter ruber]
MESVDSFGARLRHIREKRGMSRRHLALKVDLSPKSIQRYEERADAPGRSDARENIRAIAGALQVRPLWLLEGHGEPENLVVREGGIYEIEHKGRVPRAEGVSPEVIPDQTMDEERYSVLFGTVEPSHAALYRMSSNRSAPFFFCHEEVPVRVTDSAHEGDVYVVRRGEERLLAEAKTSEGDLEFQPLHGGPSFSSGDSVHVNGEVLLSKVKIECRKYINGELIPGRSAEDEASDSVSGPGEESERSDRLALEKRQRPNTGSGIHAD